MIKSEILQKKNKSGDIWVVQNCFIVDLWIKKASQISSPQNISQTRLSSGLFFNEGIYTQKKKLHGENFTDNHGRRNCQVQVHAIFFLLYVHFMHIQLKRTVSKWRVFYVTQSGVFFCDEKKCVEHKKEQKRNEKRAIALNKLLCLNVFIKMSLFGQT